MSVKKFLIIAGISAILLSLAGFFHILGPDAAHSILGDKWWLDNTENWIHMMAGLLSLGFALLASKLAQQAYCWTMIAISIGISVYSITVFHFLMVNVEDPVEEVLYFSIGNIALWVMLHEAKKEAAADLKKLTMLVKANQLYEKTDRS